MNNVRSVMSKSRIIVDLPSCNISCGIVMKYNDEIRTYKLIKQNPIFSVIVFFFSCMFLLKIAKGTHNRKKDLVHMVF